MKECDILGRESKHTLTPLIYFQRALRLPTPGTYAPADGVIRRAQCEMTNEQ